LPRRLLFAPFPEECTDDVSKRNDGLQFNMGNRAILRIPFLGDTV